MNGRAASPVTVSLQAVSPQRRRHQQRGDELRRDARVDRCRAAREVAAAIDHYRRASDCHARSSLDAELPSASIISPIGRSRIRGFPSSLKRPRPSVRKPSEEAHRGAGVADEQVGARSRNFSRASFDLDTALRFVALDLEAEHF